MKNIIEIKNVNFKYPGAKKDKWHLSNVSINIEDGKWTTILGPNGSGKSTLAKAIVKINKIHKGEILINGKHFKDFSGKEFAKKIAYIPQQVDVPHGTTVYDFVSFGRNPYLGVTGTLSKEDKHIIEDTMKQTRTWDWRQKNMDELSGGQKQKVLIAMIIVQDADVILLDEPTTYLDIRNQYELLEMMHHEHIHGKTIITILHDINQAVQYSDYIYILKEGKIYAEGKPKDTITQKTLEDVYGVKAILYEDKGRKFLTDVKLIDFDFGQEHPQEVAHTEKSKVQAVDKETKK